jgi:hypothetical protein
MWPRSNLHSRPEISGDPYYAYRRVWVQNWAQSHPWLLPCGRVRQRASRPIPFSHETSGFLWITGFRCVRPSCLPPGGCRAVRLRSALRRFARPRSAWTRFVLLRLARLRSAWTRLLRPAQSGIRHSRVTIAALANLFNPEIIGRVPLARRLGAPVVATSTLGYRGIAEAEPYPGRALP